MNNVWFLSCIMGIQNDYKETKGLKSSYLLSFLFCKHPESMKFKLVLLPFFMLYSIF